MICGEFCFEDDGGARGNGGSGVGGHGGNVGCGGGQEKTPTTNVITEVVVVKLLWVGLLKLSVFLVGLVVVLVVVIWL